MENIHSRITCYIAVLISVLLLSSCSNVSKFFDNLQDNRQPALAKKKPVRVYTPIQEYTASNYVTNLSIANIILANGGSVSDISVNSKVIENYTKQKKSGGNITIISLDYTGKDGSIIAPISNEDNLDSIAQIISSLGAETQSLKEIRVLRTNIPAENIFNSTANEAELAQDLVKRLRNLISNSTKLSALEEAQLQLKLLQYFTDIGQRDAAYICADNVKRLLEPVNKAGDKSTTNKLTKDLEYAESHLRKKMPY